MLEVEFRPFRGSEVENESFVCDDEFSCIDSRIPETETAPPKSTAFLGETMVKVWPNRGLGTSPATLTF